MSRKRRQYNKTPTKTQDSFSNPVFRLGFGSSDPIQGTAYPLTRLTQDWTTLTSLYRSSWIVQNIINIVPQDMLRKWYIAKTGVGPDYLDELRKIERKTRLIDRLQEGLSWGRLYGGAVAVIMIKGQEDLSQPLDMDAIMPGAFMGLLVLDRWSGVWPEGELVTDPESPDFGLPKYYSIREEEGLEGVRVHHSRVIRFIGRELPWLQQVTEQYWGESELEAILDELKRRDNVSANMAALTFKANRDYMQIEGMEEMLAGTNAAAQNRLYQVLLAQNIMDSNFGMRVLNKGDEMHNTQYTFTGLPEVYECMMMDIAGAARIPVTKLFGRSPAGMNATGESDMRNYYDYIDGLRETVLRPILERLLPILALSAWGVIPDDLEVDFEPMETPDSKELAEIAEKKTNAILSVYQNDLIDGATAVKELQAMSEETGMYSKIEDNAPDRMEGVTYTQSKLMQDPIAGIGGING